MKARLSGQQRLHAEELMHQQLFVMGRDIESRHGNLLLRYGGNRQPSTLPAVPSLYAFPISNKCRIVFRNFGVIVDHDVRGGMFLKRNAFEARLLRPQNNKRTVWLPSHLPPLHNPRSPAERIAAAEMLQTMVQWFCRYEAWIQTSFGRHYRIGQLVRFKIRNNIVWKWDMLEGWNTVLSWLGG